MQKAKGWGGEEILRFVVVLSTLVDARSVSLSY